MVSKEFNGALRRHNAKLRKTIIFKKFYKVFEYIVLHNHTLKFSRDHFLIPYIETFGNWLWCILLCHNVNLSSALSITIFRLMHKRDNKIGLHDQLTLSRKNVSHVNKCQNRNKKTTIYDTCSFIASWKCKSTRIINAISMQPHTFF